MKPISRILASMAVGSCLSATGLAADESTPINGLVYLINSHADEPIDGLLRWELELRERGLTAMVKASNPVLEAYPEVFRRLAAAGHEIIGGYPGICWDKPYEEQLAAMAEVKAYMEDLTGQPMRIFACSYSSYDKNTLRAAEELGVPYVLARGTEDVRALIYRPEEYDVGLIEVSNVAFGELGRGSLCDISLFARGATEDDFAQIFAESVAKHPDSMILVSHPHIGGTKTGYWEVYESALAEPALAWRPFDAWLDSVTVIERPLAQIPENRELQYLEPQPAVPLEDLASMPEVGDKLVMFHNGEGPMCREAAAFIAGLDYPVEEHLVGERNFLPLLESYRARYSTSEGVSKRFELFPLIFIEGRAFSGFDGAVRSAIEVEVAD
jgi:hypothetical protein